MKFIKQTSIDTVLEEAKIYDVVNHSEKLVKKGIHWFCLSPFTGETGTPSFSVNEQKNTFFDYSGGFGGNAVSFIMKKNAPISFFEAITKVAEICNITLEYDELGEDAKRIHDDEQSMKKVLEFANVEYQKAFHKLPSDHWAKEMIVKERAFSEEIIQAFGIGYAPNTKTFVSTPLINNGNFEHAIHLGLSKTKEGGSWDFFRDRIMFPITNDKGIVVGFGGRRSNEESAKEYAKYLNSIESKIYHKEKIVYGLFQAKKAITTLKSAILVEGYTDVIGLHNKGVENVIASCGTALTEFHAKLISRFTKHVIIFRDGDKAGQKAAMRDIDILIKEGLKVTIVICPEEEDPESLSQKCDINIFLKNNALDGIIWKANVLHQQAGNPDLPQLIETIKTEHNKEVELIKDDLAPESSFKDLSPFDKKFLKKKNDEKFKLITQKEKELKVTIADLPKYEPQLLSDAIQSIGMTLHRIPNKLIQKEYVKLVANAIDQKPPTLQQIITEIENQETAERKKKMQVRDTEENNVLGLPKGANKEQFLTDRFCEIGNSYYFQTESGTGFIKGTNHLMTPLFHVEGRVDNKRLCQVENEDGQKRLIDFDSKDLINFNRIQERLVDEGNFFWEPGTTVKHFKLVAKKLLNNFHIAQEIKTLGQQREGFFSFADGTFHQNQFLPVNKYGIVYLEGLKKIESEYKADVKHYYTPAFSEIYKNSADDDDPYENDRHFVFKEAPISLDHWMTQVVKVFGDKGKFGVAFCLAANFRDLFITHYNYFPLMGGFGQKDSGKSGLGKCLQSFFFYDLLPLELNTATLVGMSRRLQRCKNVVTFFDEMREDLDEEKFQMTKGVWNGIGREKGKGADSNRTTTDKINAALYYSGQYIPTRDDGALASRTIMMMFQNNKFSNQEKEEYQKLINWSNSGLSSFIIEVIKHRDHAKANLLRVYSECARELKKELEGKEYQNRIFENYLAVLSVVKLLQDKFNFPFKYDEFLKLTRDYVIDNSDLISDSDGLAKFWNILEFLTKPMNPEKPMIVSVKAEEDYQIERTPSFKILVKKDEEILHKNVDGDQILFLNFKSVHQYYHKEASSRKGEEIIGESTLRNYIKSKPYFIGLFKSKRMGDRTPSGYAFNYTMMNRMGILNIDINPDNQIEMDLNPPKRKNITNPAQASLEIPSADKF